MTLSELGKLLDRQLRQEFPLLARNPHGAELCGELARRLARVVKKASNPSREHGPFDDTERTTPEPAVLNDKWLLAYIQQTPKQAEIGVAKRSDFLSLPPIKKLHSIWQVPNADWILKERRRLTIAGWTEWTTGWYWKKYKTVQAAEQAILAAGGRLLVRRGK